MNLQISGSILDPQDTAEGFLNAAANSAVLRLIAFDASKNYIDVIDCATGNSVGTGSIESNGTFTVQVDIRANAGKTIMLVIGLKTADGNKGIQIYKCLLGRMPKTNEIPDSTALDSMKITNVDVSFESTAKALFAMEKGIDKDPAEPFFSISTAEVQAGKTVSKSFSTDNAFQKKIESESGGAENIAQVASAVRALAILAASNVSDTLKSDILQGPVQNASEALNTYSRLIAQSDDQSVSTIITQNLIPTELKLSTAGGTTVVNGSSTASTNKDAVTGIAAASINDTPVFNIKDGEYTDAQTISMSTNTAGAVIYYTLDGSSPSESFGIKYETPFSISMSAQIKAAAFKSGSVASPAACLNLSIKLPASSVENFYYRVENAGITITYYKGTDVNITIPDTIDGKPVVTIGNGAFCTSNLTSIVMPDSVTSIKSIAFFNCQTLESVTLSKNITNIDLSAFSGCTSLKSIVLPDSLTSIGNSAFSRCPKLTSVTLPENLTSIGNHSFFSCTGLKKIIIPGKVNSIGSNAFGSCSSMYDITIPASVNSMGDGLSNFRNVYFEGDIPTFTTGSNSYNFGARVIFYYLANKKGWATRPNNQPAASYDINSSKIRIPNSGSFTDTDYNAKKISGTISWTAANPTDGILGYHIYWGKDMRVADSNRTGDKLSDNAEILYTVAGAAATSQKVPINTSIPEGAKCFLIYSFDANGDSAARCAVAIKDIVKPIPTVLPTNGRFTDTDINVSKISGNITWNPSDTTETIHGYKIYFGHDATTILEGYTSKYYTVSGKTQSSLSIEANTALPAGATHFLIYPYNASGNSSLCLAVPILDLTVSSPTILATSGAFTDSDINASRISGEITWTPANPATGISGYKIYWGQNATTILSGNTSEVYTVSGAAAASQTVAANTALPAGATHFLIYSFNANGNSAEALAVGITDNYIPAAIPTSGTFTDADLNANKISGNIAWTAANPATGITGYKIYWGENATTKLTGNTTEVYTVSGATTASQAVATNTTLPSGATHFLIYSYNANGDSPQCLAVAIADAHANDFDYTDSGAGITLTGYKGAGGKVVIPSEINGKPVVAIGARSFANSTLSNKVTEITIPGSITNIVSYAFEDNTSLTSVTFGDGNISIDSYAFNGCTGLKSITIGDGVTSVGTYAFNGCTGLKSVYFKGNAPTYGSKAFAEANYPILYYLEGKTGWTTPKWNNNPTATYTNIPQELNIPASGSFTDTDLNANKISGNIAWVAPNPATGIIGYKIYWGENATTKLTGSTTEVYTVSGATTASQAVAANTTLPSGATHFLIYSYNADGNSAACLAVAIADANDNDFAYFDSGANITIIGYKGAGGKVVIPSTINGKPVVAIYNSAFQQASIITEIKMPDSLTSIGESAFRYCTALTSVTFGSGFISIDVNAFDGCTGLTSVNIDSGSIGNYAFYHCTGLRSITMGAGVTSIGQGAFSGCTGLTSVTIGAGVTSIGQGAFIGCTGLTSVTMGAGVTSIGQGAFYVCTGLTSVYFEGNAPTYGSKAFAEANYPILYYLEGKTGWTTPKWNNNPTATYDLKSPKLNIPASGSFTDTDINANKISGNITWTAANPSTGITGYKIYWGENATTKLTGNTAEVYTVSGAATASQAVAANTSLPSGATHFLIYSYNADGDSAARLAVPITDKAVPTVLPTTGSFTDTDINANKISGNITWTAANPSTGITGYKIYWGENATTKSTDNTTEVYTVSGATTATQEVAANTSLPSGATHFLIYSYNADGNSAACLAVPIVDKFAQVETPVLPPASMSAYYKTVTITCATTDAVILYVTNGSDPLLGTVYKGPFTVNATTTVTAIATKTGMANSAQASAIYTIYYPDITPPSSPAYSPANNATGIALNTAPTLTFSEALYTASAAMEVAPTGIIKVYEGNDNTGTALTEGAGADNVHFTVAYDSANRKFTVTFGADLKNYQSYYIELQANKVYDSARNSINSAQGVKFTTIASAAPAITGYTAGPGTVFGSVKVTYAAGAGNSLKYVKQAGAFTTPLTGTDASAIGTAYTSGDNITGAAPTQHIGIYEINASNLVVKFVDILLAPAAPIVGLVTAPGTVSGTTKITYAAGAGNSLKYVKQALPIMIPLDGDDASTLGAAYTSGDNIAGAAPSEHIGLYEIVTATNRIVKFADVLLIAEHIAPAPAISGHTVAPGTVSGSTKITYAAEAGNSLKFVKQVGAFIAPLAGDDITMISPTSYTSGNNIADANATEHIGLFEVVTGTNTVVKFIDITLADGDIASPAPAILGHAVAQGTVSGSTKITYTPALGNSLKYVKQAGAFTTPHTGTNASLIGTPYTSGADITIAVAGEHIGLYEINATSNLVINFIDITLAAGDILP